MMFAHNVDTKANGKLFCRDYVWQIDSGRTFVLKYYLE